MWAALVVAAAAVAIAALRLRKTFAVPTLLFALGAAIAMTWRQPPQFSYAWLPSAHAIFAERGDAVSRYAAALVAAIAGIVAVYALGDPEVNEDAPRFFTTYALFVAAMLAFVAASSVLFAYVCWEVMGVASFVLIGHAIGDVEAGRSARRAFTTTRIGDLAVLIGAVLLLRGSTGVGASFLVVGAAVKSAQLGASPWLVGAMVAPTPVSALLHSATLVAAGPYLVARFVPLSSVPSVAISLLIYAAITALAAAVFAATSDDAKRTLAWSSIEQLAQSFVAAAVGMPLLALGVLAGHAIAKPVLFFAAGMQRIATGTSRYATASRSSRRVTAFVGAIAYGGIALVGIPPFVSSWALADTWTAAGRLQPVLTVVGIALAALGGWYVARFALLLMPEPQRPFEARRIGTGASVAVWLMCAAGIGISLVFRRGAVDVASVALPIAALVGAGACIALRDGQLVRRPPLFPNGITAWDRGFTRLTLAFASTLALIDRGLLVGSDRLGANFMLAGARAEIADRAIDRATTVAGNDIVAGGERAGSLVAGDASRYLALSGAVFVAAALAAVVIVLVVKALV